jgi:F-type H+-transporting ATPase subunit delta
MANNEVATPYAQALLDIVVERGTLAAVRPQVDAIAALAAESFDLGSVFANPTVTESERKAVVGALCDQLGADPMLRNFLLLLSEKRRLAFFGDIAAVFGQLADAREGVVTADVTSASELTAAQQAKLATTLESVTGRRVRLAVAVDPSLLGGLRVTVDGHVYDTSVKNQLDALRGRILNEL